VLKRIERMERKVEGTPNSERMLDVAKKLRLEKEKERELQSQKQEQRNAIQVGGISDGKSHVSCFPSSIAIKDFLAWKISCEI